jgi:hypothetical protein
VNTTPHALRLTPHTSHPPKQNQKNVFHRKNQPFIENSAIIKEIYCNIVNNRITILTIPHLLTYFIAFMTKSITQKTTTKLAHNLKNYCLSCNAQIKHLTCLLMLLFASMSWGQVTVQIGSGNTRSAAVPIVSNYGFTYSQQLYLASEYNASSGTGLTYITKLRLYYNGTGTGGSAGSSVTTTTFDDWTIFLGNTSKTSFSSKTDWVSSSSLSQVFSGTVTFPSPGNWMEITLASPFVWDGSSNLVVAIDENKASFGTLVYWGANTSATNRGIHYRNDSTNPNPTSPPTATDRVSNVPFIQFVAQTPPSPCSGTPSPGNTIASVNPVGSGSSTVLSLQNATTGSGVTYQWKSSNDNITYTNISGATNATYTATPSAATYYVCAVTCSGVTTTSNPVQVTLIYCTPTSASSSTYHITGVTITGGVNNFANTATGSGLLNSYSNYSSTISCSQYATGNINYSISLAGNASSNSYSYGLALWVDWNNNLVFETSERMYNSAAYIYSASGSFTVPSGTPLGNYRMRIVTDYDATSPTACALSSGNGEIEDYTLTVVAQPTCMAPTALATSSITNNSASLSWTASVTAPSSGYDVYYSTTNTAPTAGTTPSANVPSGTTYAFSGLTASTTYYSWVRSNCGSGDVSLWVASASFKTSCNPVSSLPWTEGFEGLSSVSTTTFPSCWSEGTGTNWNSLSAATSYYNDPRTGNYYIGCYYGGTNDRIWTPGFQLTAGVSYDFSTYFVGDGYSGWTGDIVYNTFALASGETVLGTSFITSSTVSTSAINYSQITRTFVPSTSGVYYFGIRITSSSYYSYLAFDDFKLELTPTCIVPTSLSVSSITNSAANLSWTASASAPGSGYDVYYSTTNTAPTAGTTPSANVPSGTTYAFTGLTANTTYYSWVRSNCGSGDVSLWVASASFTTQCDAFSTFPWTEGFEGITSGIPTCWGLAGTISAGNSYHFNSTDSGQTGRGLIFNSFSSSSGSTSELITPTLDLSTLTTAELKFYFKNPAGGNFEVLISTNNGSTYTSLQSSLTGQTAWLQKTYTITSYISSTVKIKFKGTSNYGYGDAYVYLDEIIVQSIPSCLPPNTLVLSSITNNSASLSWTAPASAPGSGYDVYYSTTNTAPTAGTTPSANVPSGTTYAFSGLTASTTYYSWVRSNCGSGDVSTWVASTSFTTLCAPISSLPWTEGFESVSTGTTVVGASTSLPSCWNSQSTQWTSSDATTYNTAKTGTKYIRYTWSTTDAFIWTLGFQLTAGVSYTFSFQAQGDGYATWVNDVFVNTSTTSSGATQLTPSYSPSGSGSLLIQSYNLVSRTFVPSTNGVYFFAIRGNQSSSDPFYMAFDDFKLEQTPNTWTGTTNASWSTASNWSLGTVPTSSDNIVISSNTPNAPVMDVDVTIPAGKSLRINSSGTLTIAPGKVLTIAGTANFNGKAVTFKSDATGAGMFGPLTTGTLTGATNVTVERFIPARRAYRFLSPAVTTSTTIRQNWQEDGVNTAGFGTHITGAQGATAGFDPTETNNPSLLRFTNGAWVGATNTNVSQLTAGNAYCLMVRGDRTTDLTSNTPTASNTVLRAKGTLFTGNFSPALSAAASGYSFIGNPYQAPLDIKTALQSSTDVNKNVVYYWDPTINARGGYITRNLQISQNNITSSVNDYVQPGQAFFVVNEPTLTSTPALTFTENHKSVGNAAAGAFRNANTNEYGILRVNLQANTNNQWATIDGALAIFNANFSWNVTSEDATKMTNLDEEVSFVQNNTNLAIALQNNPSATSELPIKIGKMRHTNYQWQFELDNYDGATPYLFDTLNNSYTQINNGTVVPFTADANTTNRFKIVFQNALLNTDTFATQVGLYPNPSKGNGFYLQLPSSAQATVKLYNTLGQEIAISHNEGHYQAKQSLAAGVYHIMVTQGEKTSKLKWIVE